MKRNPCLRLCAAAMSLALLLATCACAKKGGEVQLSTTAPLSDEFAVPAAQNGKDGDVSFDTYVILNDENTTINGSGATFENGVLTVHAPGAYYLRGTLDGSIIVNTDAKKEVLLFLSGVALQCDGAVLNIAHAPGGTRLVLAQSSVNDLSNRKAQTNLTDPRGTAVICSEDALSIEGDGRLNITAAADGVRGKGVVLKSGTVVMYSEGNGFATDGNLQIIGGNLLTCAGQTAASGNVHGVFLRKVGDYAAGEAFRILGADGGELAGFTLRDDCADLLIAHEGFVCGETYVLQSETHDICTFCAAMQ